MAANLPGRRLVVWGVLAVVGVAVAVWAVGRSMRTPALAAPRASFCAAAREYDHKLGKGTLGKERELELIATMARTAPRDVRRDAQRFLAAMTRLRAGDTSVRDRPRVEAAVDAVNRRAANGCGFYERSPGGL